MPPDVVTAITPLVARLTDLVRGNPALGRELAAAARAMAEWLDAASGSPAPAPPPVEVPSPPVVGPRTPPVWVPFIPAPVAVPPGRSTFTYPAQESSGELQLLPPEAISRRCRLKAEAARLVASRAPDAPANLPPVADERDLQTRSTGLPDCWLWMLQNSPVVSAYRVWADLAGAFETTADAAALLTLGRPDIAPVSDAEPVLKLLAEVQSTLLYAVIDTQGVRFDTDQIQIFAHVRQVAKDRQIFIHKFLKRDDRADPAVWPDVRRRVAELAERFKGNVNSGGGAVNQEKHIKKVIGNLRHKLHKLADEPAATDEWPRVYELIADLISCGVPPSSIEIREPLLPVYDRMPDDLEIPPGVAQVFRAIETYLATRPPAFANGTPDPMGAEVQDVAALLRGREVVFIGGQVRPDRRAALIRSLDLADLNWITTPEHTSVSYFEPAVARPEVAVVILATRWANHDYQNVKAFCETHGKLFVKLPAGYHPNQVAHQILAQVGDKLRAAAAVSAA